ncbi:MAG: helix-turn-helix domain-containing protein [Longimicrobiaceae bacterium]
MVTLCARFAISRQTGYTTVARYEALGVDGLKDGSHAPLSCPQKIPEAMRALLVERARHTRPGVRGRSWRGWRRGILRPPCQRRARSVTCTAARGWWSHGGGRGDGASRAGPGWW